MTFIPRNIPTVTIYRGDTTVFPTYVLRDVNDDLINLTDGNPTWAAQWRETPDGPAMLEIDVSGSDWENGSVSPVADAETTAAMETSGYWDLQATYEDGTVQTWLRGKTQLVKDVTRV